MKRHETKTKLKQLEAIIDEMQDGLFRFAYVRTGSKEDAEDIVQDVMLRLFRDEKDLDKVANLKYYLLRSISNRCMDFHRKCKAVRLPIENAGDITDDDNQAEMQEDYRRIHRLLESLPEKQAETIMLRCTGNLTFAEIARAEKAPEATVKSRWRYGIQSIREMFYSLSNVN